MGQKAKTRTIKDDKQERKKYIEQYKGDIDKDIIKIRLHIWDFKKNYEKEEEQLCPLCEIEEDTIEHVLRCGRDTDRKQRNTKNNTEEQDEVVQIYRENKRKREERREKVQEESFRFGCLLQP